MLSGGLIVGQLGDTALQFGRDSTRISVGCETDEFANAHSNLAGRCEFATGLLDFEEAIDTQRQDWNAQMVGEQSDARLKRKKMTVTGVVTFGKDKDAVAAIDALASVGKALLEAGGTRERKQIQ